ncbi:MAG: hypothetical protein M0008_09570 [Actinomycetota bacterium]|nr:hypothetical protein [Actinomycetota bacterium]
MPISYSLILTVTPRIEIELTSTREDGRWTWRAAGAREPRGLLDGGILYDGAKVGDVVRADAEFFMDGISIATVHPPRVKQAPKDRLEVVGIPRPAPGDQADERHPPSGARRREKGSEHSDSDADRARSRSRDAGARNKRGGSDRATAGQSRSSSAGDQGSRPTPARERSKRFVPGTAHRDALLKALQADQRSVAEQLLRGGIPAVRRALDQRNDAAKAAGEPVADPSGVISLAEELLPRVNAALWLDKAEAASKNLRDVPLRDLRSIVAGASALTLDEPSRMLAAGLRDALSTQVEGARKRWLESIERALADEDVPEALTRSARPPDPGARFPAELALRLAEVTSNVLDADLEPDRWQEILQAAMRCPARRMIKPKGFPPAPTKELLQAARQACAQIPSIASLLGMSMPPPPPPRQRPHGPTQSSSPATAEGITGT